MFAVGLFAHFDIADGIAAFFDVGNLRGGIFGSAVEHGDGNHRGQIVGDTAGEEEIEAGVLIVAAIADVFCRMPGIDGGASIGCRAFRGSSWRRRESAASIDASDRFAPAPRDPAERATTYTGSSIDPWHSAEDIRDGGDSQHTRFDLLLTSGLTNKLHASLH